MRAIDELYSKIEAVEAAMVEQGKTPKLVAERAMLQEHLEGWRRALGLHVHTVTEPVWEGEGE